MSNNVLYYSAGAAGTTRPVRRAWSGTAAGCRRAGRSIHLHDTW